MGTVKYSGPVASFHCPTEATIRSLKVHFSPKQLGEGTPSPENVREISGTNDITCSYGKEVLTIGNFDSIGKLQYLGSNTFFVEGEISDGVTIKNIPVEKFILKPNKEYSIICEYISGQFGNVFAYRFQDANNNRLSIVYNDLDTNTKLYIANPAPVETQYDFINMTLSIGPGTSNLVFKMYLIEKSGTLSSNWSSTIGTLYGGWVDLITGEVASTYIHCKIKDLPGEWNYRSGNNRFQITLTDDYANAASSGGTWTNFATSEVYKTSTSNGYGNKQIATYIDKHIYIRDDDFEGDVEAFLNGVGDTYVTYELAESTTYSLSPTSMQTFLGQNNIWSNADYVEVEYDLHETQSILARKQFIIANQPHVESASGSISSFNTDISAPLKECKAYFEPKQDLHGYDRPWIGGAGKNLFNINAVEQNPSDTTAANTTQRVFTPGTYAVGTSWSNWWQPNQVTSYSITNNTLTIQNSNVYGIGFAFKLTPETTYTISATSTNGGINIAYYDVNGNYITTSSSNILNTSFIVPAEADIAVLIFYSRTSSAATFTNIQLELGSIATSYEPYENICPISGWTGLNVFSACPKRQILPTSYQEYTDGGITMKCYPSGEFVVDGIVTSGTVFDINIRPIQMDFVNEGIDAFFTGCNVKMNMYDFIFSLRDDGGNIIMLSPSWSDYYGQMRVGDLGDFVSTKEAASLRIYIGKGYGNFTFVPYFAKDSLINVASSSWESETGTIYGGYVDLVTGEVWKEWHTISVDENTPFRVYTPDFRNQGLSCNGSYWLSSVGASNAAGYEPYSTDGYCDKLPYLENNYAHIDRASATNSTFEVGLAGTRTQEQFLAWMAENGPIMICYRLATPVLLTTLTPTQLKTLRGTNNIWSNANGDIEVKYWSH